MVSGIARQTGEWQFYDENTKNGNRHISNESIGELRKYAIRHPELTQTHSKIGEMIENYGRPSLDKKNLHILDEINTDFPPKNQRDKVDNYNTALAISRHFTLVVGDGKKFDKARKYEAQGKLKIISHHRGTKSKSRMNTEGRKGNIKITY